MAANIGPPNYYQLNAQANQRLDCIEAEIESNSPQEIRSEALFNLYNDLSYGITDLQTYSKVAPSNDFDSIRALVLSLESTRSRVGRLFQSMQNKIKEREMDNLTMNLSSMRVNACLAQGCKMPSVINSKFCSQEHEMQNRNNAML